MALVKVVVHGLGNIGKNVLESLQGAPDMECLGVIRRPSSVGKNPFDLKGVEDFGSLADLIKAKGKPDVAIVCGPSRNVPEDAAAYLKEGICTVDSFDIHTDIRKLVEKLEGVAKDAGTAAITAAGWDPGTDSVMRALFEAMAPVGTTFTNFGRGRSMGHSVAARAIKGVKDATSITIPMGGGKHARLVYILAEKGASFEQIKKDIAADPYFSHDPLDVREVKNEFEMHSVADNSHGVLLERIGASGAASNQRFSFDMRIDNPALTAQVLVSCARAVKRMQPGCYTLIDVPLVKLLPGERIDNIERLV